MSSLANRKSVMFRCPSSSDLKALQSIYHKLHCDFHIVSEGPKDVPNIPSLTPSGFVRWMTCCILAAPDQEASRLCQVVEALPIELSTPSSRSERLPKQLSRHLLPAKPDHITKEWMLRACEAEGLPTSRSCPYSQGSKRGREEYRDDASRRYMPPSRLDDYQCLQSQSRKHRQCSTTRTSDSDRRRHSRHSPERARRSQRDASPSLDRRGNTSKRSSAFVEDDRHYRASQSDRVGAPSLKRAASTRSRRHTSPDGRDRRQSYRELSPDRYSRQRRGSYHPDSSENSPGDSFESGGAIPRRQGSHGQTYADYPRDSGRSERKR
jgi:hypothetical protein